MGSQTSEAREFRNVLQKLRDARAGKSDSTSQRQAIDRRRQELEAMLAQAEQAYEAAAKAYDDTCRRGNASGEKLRAQEAALKRLREVQAQVWPQQQAMEDGGFGADRAIGQASNEVAFLQRRAASHLKTMEENVEAAQQEFEAAVEQLSTLESWLPLYDHGRRQAITHAVNANRAKIQLSADYAQDVYTLQKRETVKKLILAVVSAVSTVAGARAAIEKALEQSLSESFKAIGAQVTKATVQELLKNPALRSQMFKTAAVKRRLLAYVLDKVARKAGKHVVKSLLKRNGDARADPLDAADLIEEGVVYAPDDIDGFARGELKRIFDRIYVESPVKAGFMAKLSSVPAGRLTPTRGGFQQVENVLSETARQEQYFRVWEALHELAGQVALAELTLWHRQVAILQDDLDCQRDMLQSCRRLAGQASVGG